MKNYIIWTPSIKLDSGGVTLLHRLAYMINKLGYNAYLWPSDNNFETFLVNSKYKSKIASKDMINDNAIVVYPEIAKGNPLNAKHVVRWILNKPGQLGGDGIFGENDMIFYYSKAFTCGKKNLNHLQIMELYGSMFEDRKQNRKGSCYVMRKGGGREIQHDLFDSTEIIDVTPSEELVKIFNEKKYFYCYDYASFLSLQAALCGCISIVVPYEDITAEQWMGMNRNRVFGIAYGEENIEHAVTTLDKVRPNIEKLEDEFYENVKEFITKTQDLAEQKESDKEKIKTNIYDFETYETKLFRSEEMIEKNDLIEAEKLLLNMQQNFPSDIRILNNLSIVKFLEKDYKEAKKIVDNILKLDKENELAIDNSEFINELLRSQKTIEETT
jgi:tetratricopeptide (TPR) repeat protein